MIPPLLRQQLFRRYWVGQTISLFGDQVTLIALPLTAVLILDAGPAQMGYLVAAELVPNLLFSLHAGALIDRRGRRREVMIATDLGRAALIATIPIAYAADALSMEHLYVVAFLAGTLTVVFSVASASLFTTLVRREDYVEASSLLYGSRAFSFVAGPTVGGAIVQVFKAPVALVIDAVSYVVLGRFPGLHSAPGSRDRRGRGRTRARRPALHPADAGHPRGPRCDGDDQLLQLHFLGALRPLS